MLPREVDPQLHSIVDEFGPLQILWSGTLLDPIHQRLQHVVLRIKFNTLLRRVSTLPEDPRAGPAIAVIHPPNPEIADPCVHRSVRAATAQLLVEAVGVERGDLIVLLAVVHEQFSAAAFELRQRGGKCADIPWIQLLRGTHVVEAEGGCVPGGVIVHDVLEPFFGVRKRKAGVQSLDRIDLATWLHCGEDELAVRESVVCEDGLELLDLGPGKAVARLPFDTEELRRVELALRGIFNHPVRSFVNGVTLPQNLIVNPRLPSIGGNEIWASDVTSNSVESSAPGDQVVEVDSRSAGDDAVEISRELLGAFDALTAPKRASEVVGFFVVLLVQMLG